MYNKFDINVTSEIGELEGVILHKPGREIENMTPQNAERALYSDILNLSVAESEHNEFYEALQKVTNTFEVKDLLTDILKNDRVKFNLIEKICNYECRKGLTDELMKLGPQELTRQLFEGVVMKKSSLTNFLSKEKYSLRPLHNFFFMRDASISVRDEVLIGKMANHVRERESIIMETIFDYHPSLQAKTFSPSDSFNVPLKDITIEGGDVLIAREDTLVIGIGARTTPQGIDFLIEHYKKQGEPFNIVVQDLPLEPESFIHLDMVFTFLNIHECMVYGPVILKPNRLETVAIRIENGKVEISSKDNLLIALKDLGFDLKPIFCGGQASEWTQEREQWHSGANFLSVGPGKILGYSRNIHTLDELSNNGYEIIKAKDLIADKLDITKINKYCISVDGTELARGGGGCRCMTMPIRRKAVDWSS
ncbi:MAG: arginine deiminase family protein [Candidatus Zophobacter franzmannii]|nr:arginine deiminase family protein [Candidatus Zophobacter franzmannii]